MTTLCHQVLISTDSIREFSITANHKRYFFLKNFNRELGKIRKHYAQEIIYYLHTLLQVNSYMNLTTMKVRMHTS